MQAQFIEHAKLDSKEKLTLPKDVRKILGVGGGDRIVFLLQDGVVQIMHSALYAMQTLQQEMAGEAERTGLVTDEDVIALVKEIRNEV